MKHDLHDESPAFENVLAWPLSGDRYSLRLFVTGTTPKSARAIQNIRAICEEQLHDRYDLEVIDIYQHPRAHQAGPDCRHADADQAGALAGPAIHRRSFGPAARVGGPW